MSEIQTKGVFDAHPYAFPLAQNTAKLAEDSDRASSFKCWDDGQVWLVYRQSADQGRRWDESYFEDGREQKLADYLRRLRKTQQGHLTSVALTQRGPKEWAGQPVSHHRPQQAQQPSDAQVVAPAPKDRPGRQEALDVKFPMPSRDLFFGKPQPKGFFQTVADYLLFFR